MKLIKYTTLIIFTLIVACTSKKNISTNKNSNNVTVKEIIKRHKNKSFNKKNVDTKFIVNFKDNNKELNFNLRVKMIKDELIYLKGTKLITFFKAKITPTTFSYYSPFFQNYIEGDFSMLRTIFGVDINFKQIQNILLGQAIFTLDKQKISNTELGYKLEPIKQNDKYSISYILNPENFRLNKQHLKSKLGELNIRYHGYIDQNNELYPKRIAIETITKNNTTQLNLGVNSLVYDSKIQVSYKIPKGYKKLSL